MICTDCLVNVCRKEMRFGGKRYHCTGCDSYPRIPADVNILIEQDEDEDILVFRAEALRKLANKFKLAADTCMNRKISLPKRKGISRDLLRRNKQWTVPHYMRKPLPPVPQPSSSKESTIM